MTSVKRVHVFWQLFLFVYYWDFSKGERKKSWIMSQGKGD